MLTRLRLARLSLMLIFTYIDFTNIVFFGVLAKALHAHDVHFHFILLFLLFFNEIDLIGFRVVSTVQRLHVYGIDIIQVLTYFGSIVGNALEISHNFWAALIEFVHMLLIEMFEDYFLTVFIYCSDGSDYRLHAQDREVFEVFDLLFQKLGFFQGFLLFPVF